MSVREYIGARYVPLFADPIDWDSTKTYEPLTVVYYQGNSYTSRQYVPAGIEITNNSYWALTGNYNAQIEAYRNEVQTFDGRIDVLENFAENLVPIGTDDIAAGAVTGSKIADGAVTGAKIADGAVTGAKIADGSIGTDDIAAGAVTLGKLSNDVTSLINQVVVFDPVYDYFKGYNVVIIGDSYATGAGASDHLSGDTKRFSTILANKLHATEFNYAVGSTGFCDPGSGGQNAPFKKQVENAIAGMTQTQINNTHLVVIAGGVNDFNEGATYSGSDMQNGAHDAVTNALNGFPNALVLVVPMLFKGNGANPRLINFEKKIIDGVIAYAGTRRVVYIQGAWTWNFGQKGNYASDNLHPNDAGHMTFANMIYTHIFGGAAYDEHLITPAWESGFSSSVTQGGYFEFMNGLVNSYGLQLNVGANLTANTQVKIGTFSMGFVTPVTGIVMKSSEVIGAWQITSAGNMYMKVTTAISANDTVFLAPISAIPSGYVV